MSAKNIRVVGILFGAVMLLGGFRAKRNWVKVLLLIFGAFQIVGNLLADSKVYEEVEAQIKERIDEQANKGEG